MADLLPLDGAGSRPPSDEGDSGEWIKCCTTLGKGRRPLLGDAMNKRKRSEQSCNKNNAELPGDVILDILLRLPVRSLGRFQCVCKAWRGIIGEQSFIRAHLQRTASRWEEEPTLLIAPLTLKRRIPWEKARRLWWEPSMFSGYIRFYLWQQQEQQQQQQSKKSTKSKQQPEARLLHAADLSGEEELGPMGHCDGLVLVRTYAWLFLVNPATEDTMPLPPPGQREPQCAGVGLDPLTGQYKVARAFRRYFDASRNTYIMGMEVFTVNDNGHVWRKAERDVPYPLSRCQTAVAVNGCLFWRVAEAYCYGSYTRSVLVRFRLADETFGALQLPDSLDDEPAFDPGHPAFTLATLHGDLWLTDTNNNMVTIWCTPVQGDLDDGIMDLGRWERRYSIPIDLAPDVCRPMALLPRGSLLLWSDSRLYRYDPATDELTTEADMDRIKYQGRRARTWKNLWSYDLLPYTESLLRIASPPS